MWHKSAEVKPSSRVPSVPAPVAIRPQDAPAAPPHAASSALPTSASATPGVAEPATSGSSRIGAGLKINGEIAGTSDLYIDGDAQGKIVLRGARVTVGPSGRVQADIEAREIVVEGTLQGNLKASERVRLGAGSRVQGTVLAPRIGIEDGAKLRGRAETMRAASASSSAAAPPAEGGEGLRPVSAHIAGE